MGISHIKDCMRVCQRAGVNVFMVGAHGTGKTTGIQQLWLEEAVKRHGPPDAPGQLASSTGEGDVRLLSTLDARKVAKLYQGPDQYRFCQVSIPNLTVEEMVGMPHVIDHDKRYQDAYVSAFTIANITGREHAEVLADICRDLGIGRGQELKYLRMGNLLPPESHTGGGVLLADEMNRGQSEVAQAWMQLIVSGTYLDYMLPEDFWIATTMNPDDSEYQVRSLDPALLNRGAVFVYYPDVEEFLSWAKARGLGENTRLFADKHRRFVNARESANQIKSGVTCTNRSLELLDRAWVAMQKDEIDRLGQTIAAGLIGADAGALYFKESTENVHRPLRVSEIIDDYGWDQAMNKDELRDYKAWPVTKARVRLRAQIKKTNVKTELIKVTLDEVSEWISAKDKELADRGSDRTGSKLSDKEKGQILNLGLFLTDIPADIARRFLLDDMQGKFTRTMFWAGTFPVFKLLNERINKNYEEAEKDDKGSR